MPDEFDNSAAARILIAEDEIIVAEDLALTLTDFGYKVVRKVQTGQLAIDLADELKPDLILMDIKLADEIDGIQASEQIRSRFDIPIIFLTAYEETDTISRAKMTEPYGFLSKPFSSYVLKTAIETALYKHAADKRVKESEQRYRTLVEQSIDGIALIQGTTVRFVNPACARMFGFESNDELEGQDLLTFVAPEFRDLVKKRAYERAEGKPVPNSYEFTALRQDGTPFAAELRVNLTTYHGKPARQAVIRDITERKKTEEALRESEQRYRRLFEEAPLMYVITRSEGCVPVISDCNQLFLSSLGYLREEVQGKPLAEFYTPLSRAELLEQGGYARALVGEFCIGERELVSRDGRLIPTVLYTATELDSAGQVIGTRAMFVDISERKQAEEALKRSEERYRISFENVKDVIYSLNSKMEVVDVTPSVETVLGYLPDDLVGRPFTDLNLLEPSSLLAAIEDTRRVLSGEIFKIPRTYSFIHKNGSLKVGEVTGTPLVKDGNIVGLVAVGRDITDRKKAEEALRKSEERYRTLFEDSRDGVYSVLRDGEITDANPAFLEILACTKEDLIGSNFFESYVDPAVRLKFQEEIEERGFVKDYEMRLRKRDGTEVDCLLTSSVQVGNDGGIVGYRGMLRDVTVQKHLQRQLLHAQKMESVGILAGGIAHDFNNLLTVILGISQLLLIRCGQRDPVYAYIEKINQAAENGADLVKRILAFSRKTEIRPRPLNLSREVEHVKELIFRTIPKMIEVKLALSNDVASINADPIQIEQILLNLAVNAADSMPDGGGLTIETKEVTLDEAYCNLHLGAKPGDYVMLSVSDTGHGMDPETLQHIFEPFYTTKQPGKGTGLGLSMVYGIVEQHGGHITCHSEPEMGTVFKVYFPVISSKAESETFAGESLFAEGSETVLLVDDDETVREMGKEMLELFGYTVLAASNGREALSLYKRERDRISLVILDLMMPEMGGKECFRNLLRLDPKVKVLIASGYASGGCLNDATELGARGFVCKPYDIKQLLGTVREVLDSD